MDTLTDDQRTRAYAICDAIAEGGPNGKLHKACRTHGVSWQTFWHWKAEDESLAARYAHARTINAQWWRDHAGEVAEDATPQTVQVAKLRHDNAKWQARVADPREFGDKVDVTSGGRSVSAVILMPPEVVPQITATATLSPPEPAVDAEPVVNAS